MCRPPVRAASWFLLGLVLCFPVPSAAAPEAPRLVADIHRQPVEPGISAASELVSLGSRVVFVASDPDHGRELWSSDGTVAGSGLLTDLCPGPCDGNVVLWHTTEGGLVFFLRGVSPGRIEIWRTDGTAAGTLRLAGAVFADPLGELPDQGLLVWVAISTGPDRIARLWASDGTAQGTRPYLDLDRSWSAQTPGTRLGDRLLFVMDTLEHGDEPWVTDGTAAGTHLLADIHPGGDGSLPRTFVSLGEQALFQAGEPAGGHEPWVTDGTSAGTRRLADLTPGPGSTNILGDPAAGDDRAYFVAQTGSAGTPQLWVSDGTATGTRQLTAFAGPQAFGELRDLDASRLQVVDGRLYFRADDGVTGAEPWTSDGTATGTRRLSDLCPGACSSDPSFALEHVPGAVLFRAGDGSQGSRLWSTDGTAAGTRRLGGACPGSCPRGPHGFTRRDAEVFFTANAGPVGFLDLWITDGSPSGTRRLTDLAPESASVQNFGLARALAGDTLLFTVYSPGLGTQVWRSDGTRAGTAPLLDPSGRASGGSSPEDLVVSGGRAFFFADDGLAGRELWTSDGTAAGTALVRDVIPAEEVPAPARLRDLTPVAGRVVLLADPSGSGTDWELWTSDGTAAGTAPLDLGGSPVSERAGFGRLGNDVLFFAEGLWTSDGTPQGTRRIAGLHAPTPAFRSFGGPFFARLGGRLLFVGADGPGVPPVLWSTDGTAAGTRPVLGPPAVLVPQQLVAAGDRVVFVARDLEHGLEPWVTDGTPGGTRRLADVYPGDGNSFPNDLVAVGPRVFFVAESFAHGRELWVTDGTESGTRIVRDLSPGRSWSAIEDLTAFGGRVAFTLSGPAGRELWTSDGTSEGTAQVLDLWPGPAASEPRELTVIGGRLFFSAGTPERGRELWTTDGTAAGTLPVPDIAPGTASSSPSGMIQLGGSILFAASDAARGRELWAWSPSGSPGPGGDPPPPVGPWLESGAVPGFRFKVRIVQAAGSSVAGTREPVCIAETLCVSGALPGRAEVFLRVVGPRPNGKLWPTLVKFTTSEVEVWIEQLATGQLRYYRLAGARPGFDELPGLFDRDGFDP